MIKNEIVNQEELNYFQQLTSIEIDNQIRFVEDDINEILRLQGPLCILEILDDEDRNIAEYFRNGEMAPDIRVAIHFDDYFEERYTQFTNEIKMYRHQLANGKIIAVKQYKIIVLPIFIDFTENHWLKEHALKYFEERDKKAFAYLPKLIAL